MTLIECIRLINRELNIKDDDYTSMVVIKQLINQAYLELRKVDKRLTTGYFPIINGICTLPNNLISIEKMTPELDANSKIIANNILTSNTGIYTIIYAYAPDRLVLDEDEIDLSEALINYVVMYAIGNFKIVNGDRSGESLVAMYENKKQEALEPEHAIDKITYIRYVDNDWGGSNE